MTHSFELGRQLFLCVPCLNCTCDMSHMWHNSFECDTTPSRCATPRPHVWRVAYVTFICDKTHLNLTWPMYMWHDSFSLWHVSTTWHASNHVTRFKPHVSRSESDCQMWHDSFIRVTCLIYMCDMPYSYVWHDSFICVTWLIHTCDMPHLYVWHALFICVTCLDHKCDMSHSYVWHAVVIRVTRRKPHVSRSESDGQMRHDSFMYVTRLIHMCDMTRSYVWLDPFIHVTWLIHTRDMTHSYIWHDSFIHVIWLIHTCDMAHSYMWHDSFIYVTWPVTAHCIWNVIPSFSNLNRWIRSLALFRQVLLKMDPWERDWRLRLKNTLNAIGRTMQLLLWQQP